MQRRNFFILMALIAIPTFMNLCKVSSRELSGSLTQLKRTYWQWSPIVGYDLLTNAHDDHALLTKSINKAIEKTHVDSENEPTATEHILNFLFTINQTTGSLEAISNLRFPAAYLTNISIARIATFLYQLPGYLNQFGYTETEKIFTEIIIRSTPDYAHTHMTEHFQQFAANIIKAATENSPNISLNSIFMTFLCLRSKSAQEIYQYLDALPQHFKESNCQIPKPLNYLTARDIIESMNIAILSDCPLIEQLILYSFNRDGSEAESIKLGQIHALIRRNCFPMVIYNHAIISVQRELFMAQSKLEVKSALMHGASINGKNMFGNTALHCAIMANNQSLVEILLKYNASIYIKNNQGLTPLAHAAQGKSPKIVKTLLSVDQDPQSIIFHAKQALNVARDNDVKVAIRDFIYFSQLT